MATNKAMVDKVYTHAGDKADQDTPQSMQDHVVTEPQPGSKHGMGMDKNFNIHNPGKGGPKPGANKVSPDRNRRTALLDVKGK